MRPSAKETGQLSVEPAMAAGRLSFAGLTGSKLVYIQPRSSPETRGCTRAPASVRGGCKIIANCCLVQGVRGAVVLGRQRTQLSLCPGIKSSCPLTGWQHVYHCFNVTMGQTSMWPRKTWVRTENH